FAAGRGQIWTGMSRRRGAAARASWRRNLYVRRALCPSGWVTAVPLVPAPSQPVGMFDLHQCRFPGMEELPGMEEHCIMFRRAKAVQSHTIFAERLVPVAAAIAVGLMLITMLTVGSAQAFSFANEADRSTGVVHKAERAAMAVSAAAIPDSADKLSFRSGYCGKGISDHKGVGCASGCCATCLSVIGVGGAMLSLHDDSIRYPLPIQSGAVSTKPPPDLRPPRTFS
ncbi:MAG TPA: hypothetical protein VJZ74_05940, partial [Pseudolabrys sp.]|nr:hypothetical protein [Pseudolabrys sp.]